MVLLGVARYMLLVVLRGSKCGLYMPWIGYLQRFDLRDTIKNTITLILLEDFPVRR
jgi:hypothetical protein